MRNSRLKIASAEASDFSKAMLNILEDVEDEKNDLANTQRAILNILDDVEAEKLAGDNAQRAILNILEDVESERRSVAQANRELQDEIRERLQAEHSLRLSKAQLEAANQELEVFSYSVAHDLRTPLRSIDGFSEVLLEDFGEVLGEEGQGFLAIMRKSAQRMARLIDGLLSLTKLNRLVLSRSQVNFVAVAENIVERLRAQDSDRELSFIAPGELPCLADPNLLEITLENLIGNAWKFTAGRKKTVIEIGSFKSADSGETIYFVRDNGAGFNMEYAEKLFQVFQRLHRTDEFEGTGIGLATVMRIINRHGGRIWGESVPNEGAVFYFTLAPKEI